MQATRLKMEAKLAFRERLTPLHQVYTAAEDGSNGT
jgi:hypothetical protein